MCVDADGEEGRQDLGRIEKGETIIRMYCIKNIYFQ